MNSNQIMNEPLSWIEGCPCFGCPYNENGQCIDLNFAASCSFIEKWVSGLHLSNNDDSTKEVKTHVIAKKQPSRWKLHPRNAKVKRQG